MNRVRTRSILEQWNYLTPAVSAKKKGGQPDPLLPLFYDLCNEATTSGYVRRRGHHDHRRHRHGSYLASPSVWPHSP